MKKLFFLLLVAMLLAACGPKPLDVVYAWQDALNKGDIDAALSYLADEATVTIIPSADGDGVFNGHAEIRGWYESGAGLGVTTLSNCQADSDTITCIDTYTDEGLQSMGVDFIEGTWVAVVRDGKIQSYTFTITPESLAKFPMPTESPVAEPSPTELPVTAATLTPETSISSAEDLIGIWKMNWEGEWYLLEFKTDGDYWVGWDGNRTGLASGKYAVVSNQLQYLNKDGSVSALYDVFVAKLDGKPATLRFVLVGEDLDASRKGSLDGKTLKAITPSIPLYVDARIN